MCFRTIVSLPARPFGNHTFPDQQWLLLRVLWCPAYGYALTVRGVKSPQGGVDERELQRVVSPTRQTVSQVLQPVAPLSRAGDTNMQRRVMGCGILLPESLGRDE